MKCLLVLLSVLWLQSSIPACMWDADTLANEAQGVPDVVRVITGRFPRNPPLYYEMRLKRVKAELNTNPTNLADYDDAAVACERLGRDDAAIAWMERKQAFLQRMQARDANWREQEYHYLANVGTFWAHRWLRHGADRRKLSEMQQARGFIAQAILLNPNAHFGREKYQLMALEWIIKPPKFENWENQLSSFLDNEDAPYKTARQMEKGLCGLVTLGAGWDSIDIFNALAYALGNDSQNDHQHTWVAYLARLRCMELVDQGHKSLLPDAPQGKPLKTLLDSEDMGMAMLSKEGRAAVAVQYKTLRAEADDWQAQRAAYMMARLQAGRHPDTDATFWNEWQEPTPPTIYTGPPFWSKDHPFWQKHGDFAFVVVSIGLPCLLGCALLRWARLRQRRARAIGDG